MNAQKLTGSFSQISPAKVLVVGDLLLDTYTIGKTKRISPEAPVAVLHVHHEEHRPGGAGNVALNLVSLGMEPIIVGRIGDDPAGHILKKSLFEEGIDTKGLLIQNGYKTPLKNRIIAENQQIVRVDHETIIPLDQKLEQELFELLPSLIREVKIIAISDYGKGFLSLSLLKEIMRLGKERGVPIISDPKGNDFTKYQGTTILKPNLSELYAATNFSKDVPIRIAACKVLEETQAKVLMVTKSEEGISLFHKNGVEEHFPVNAKEVKDVTGAGDTVLATMACALANDLNPAEGAQLSNVAAGIAIERFGCARVSLGDLARRLLQENRESKIFDEEHLFALQQALYTKPFILFALYCQAEIFPKIFKAIQKLSNKQQDLVIYIRDENPAMEFVEMIAALQDVTFILVKKESLTKLCLHVSPKEIYSLEENLVKLENIDSVLSETLILNKKNNCFI